MRISSCSEGGEILKQILGLFAINDKIPESEIEDWSIAVIENRGVRTTAICELEGNPPKLQLIIPLNQCKRPVVYAGNVHVGNLRKSDIPNAMLLDFIKLQGILSNLNISYFNSIDDNQKEIVLYYYMPAAHFLDVLSEDEIKVSLPENCNDPLEFLAEGQETITKPGGFISFSTCSDNSLMWANYADSHKGVCLQFKMPIARIIKYFGANGCDDNFRSLACELGIDGKEQYSLVPLIKKSTYKALLVSVLYSQHRPPYSSTLATSFQSGGAIESYGIAAEYYTKSLEWRYEKEWRLMITPENVLSFRDKTFFVKGLTKYLSMVILGKKFNMHSNTAAAMIIKSLKKNPHFKNRTDTLPKIRWAQFDEKRYKIIIPFESGT